jgi:hypothetical protein
MHFEGWRYSLGDFTVCVGRATLKPKQEFRGFVVEIHYHPLSDLTMGQGILAVGCLMLMQAEIHCEPDSKHARCPVMRSSIKITQVWDSADHLCSSVSANLHTAFMDPAKQQWQ